MNLNKLHEQLCDILFEFDRVCRKHDIKYSLAYGTLLGAVRHKGMIPWDDDVDVMLDRENFDRFCEICPSELGKDYFFQSKKTERAYPYNICRIRKNNTAMIYDSWRNSGMHLGIYIDIYPVDNIPDNKIKRFIQKWAIIFMTPIRISRNPVVFNTGGMKFNQGLKKIIKFATKIAPKKLCEKIENYYIEKYRDKHCKTSGIICEGGVLLKPEHAELPFESYYMQNIENIEFGGRELMAVADWKGLLTHWYGDYMKLPPEEERIMTHKPEIFDTHNSYKKYINGELN